MSTSLEEVIKQLEDSGIIAPDTMASLRPDKAASKDPQEFVRSLVKQGKVTDFQAQEICQGSVSSLTLGNYLILEKIGAGGMGQVFKARHRRMDRVVAVKKLPASMTADPAAIARFEREVKAAARLSHPNIVTSHDADEYGGIHFLVMEFVEGSDLSAVVKKNGPLSVTKAVSYILQAARGLEYAHKHGVVHRDIKPANLLLGTDGTVKVLDMGLARIQQGDGPAQAELTGTGYMMGTVDYMSPEQAVSTRAVGPRTDVYSLGCTLWYLLTGRAIYDGDTAMSRMLNHREAPIPSLCAARDDVPYGLEIIYQKMVAKQPEDRYPAMDVVVRELEDLQANTSGLSGLAAGEASALSVFSELVEKPASTKREFAAGDAPPLGLREGGAGAGPKRGISAERSTRTGGGKRKQPPVKLIAAAAAGILALLWGVIFIIRDKDGNEEPARVAKLTEGSTIEVQKKAASAGKRATAPPTAIAPFDVMQAHAHQQAWAKYLGVPVEQKNSIGMPLLLIPPGEFLMGSTPEQNAVGRKMAEDAELKPDDYVWARLKDEGPQHRVTLTKPYWLGATEVTLGQFRRFVDAAKYVTEAERFGFGNSGAAEPDDKTTPEMKKMTWRTPGYAATGDSPVTQVTWDDAVQFCNWLSAEEKLMPCYRQDAIQRRNLLASGTGYRLPTEAEWEYACRAGTTTQFSFGDDPAMLDIYGWFVKNSGGSGRAVGLKVANAFGLFDMHGNALEWCHDFYAPDYYSKSQAVDPSGPPSGPSSAIRASRGGSLTNVPVSCRSAQRIYGGPHLRNFAWGFRVLRVQ